MNNKEFERIAGRMFPGKTQSSRKLVAYVMRVIESNEFKSEIRNIRSKFNLPKNGFHYSLKTLVYNPPDSIAFTVRQLIDKEADRLCAKYKLHIVDWSQSIASVIYYDRVIFPFDFQSGHLFQLADLKIQSEEPFSKSIKKSDNTVFPIAIRISPYATKRDLLDFVDKAFPFIQFMLSEYKDNKIKIGKYKTRKPENVKKNEFVYKNRNLPLKEIAEKLSEEKNIEIDEGHVGSILSIEKRRRRKV